jgi:NAD(P)H dehydrogenase (quinone)
MAQAVAEGVRAGGASVDVKRVPETVPHDIATSAHFKLDQAAPVASIADLADYDALIVGAPTRFGRMPAQMAAFLDQAGGLWARGALNGKVGAAFTSTATQHGGQEVTLFSIITNLMHFGMIIVGLPYSHQGQMTLDEVVGGSPYGATTIAGGQGQRQPSAIELEGARHQVRLVAETANTSCSADRRAWLRASVMPAKPAFQVTPEACGRSFPSMVSMRVPSSSLHSASSHAAPASNAVRI